MNPPAASPAPAPAGARPAAFVQRLESLRGVAALMVAVFHSFMIFSTDWLSDLWREGLTAGQHAQSVFLHGLMVFCNGPAAVVVFFVLSGYVLGRSLEAAEPGLRTVAAFYARRVLRIYPLHVFWILLIVAGLYFIHTKSDFADASRMFEQAYREPLSAALALKNMALLQTGLNPVTWTLRVEMAASLLIPFFFLLYRKRGLAGNLLVLAVLMAVSYAYAPLSRWASDLWPAAKPFFRGEALSEPVFFAYMFYAGIMLPRLTQTALFRLGRFGDGLFFAAALLLVSANLLFSWLPVSDFRNWAFQFCEAAGAVYIVGFISCHQSGKGFLQFLDHKLIHVLGRVSFSFYVTHFAVLYAVSWCLCLRLPAEWSGKWPVLLEAGLALTTVPLTFVISLATYRWVEVPFLNLGKALSRRILPPRAVSVAAAVNHAGSACSRN